MGFPASSEPRLGGFSSDPESPDGDNPLIAAAGTARDTAVLALVPDGIVILDEAHVITEFNPAAEQMFGRTRADVRGQSIDVLLDRSDILQSDTRVETTARYADGRRFPVEVAMTRVSAGGRVEFAALIRDVSERRRSAADLRASDERMRFAIEAAGMGVWEVDILTRDVTWTEIKPPARGGPPRRFAGTEEAFLAGIHVDDREATRLAIDGAIVERHDLSLMFRTVTPGGEPAWVEWRGRTAAEADPVPTRIVGVSTDVTQREMLESQLRQAQKMEAVGQLAGGVAHDFNNLLTAILGYAKLAAAGLAPDQRRRRDIDEITKAAERAASLTRQLLAFSRNQVLRSTIIDLNALVRGVSEMLRRLIGEQILLDVVLAPDLALVLADAGQLEQVVVNLSLNARDAMEQGGRLTLQTANVELHAATGLPGQVVVPGWYVMLAVIDTGVGMDPHTKRHLFEPFFTTKEQGKGTGLGLATVYGIVKQSSGYIRAESEPGKGAAFRVYLPRAVSQVVPAPRPVAAPSAGRGAERLLLVEDEASVRHLAGRVLEDAGYHVLHAPSGAHAEAIVAGLEGELDLLVTDVIMPGMSGPELFHRLAAGLPGLRVVYMSGYANETMSRELALEAGQSYLQKPFTADQLVSCVRGALDGPVP